MKKYILLMLLLLAVFASQTQALTKEEYLRGNAYLGSQNARLDRFYLHLVDFENIQGTQLGTGSLFYLDSAVVGATAGTSWETAVDTLKEAIALCANNNGDYIYVAQGHAENITNADAVVANKAGITIYGFGENEDQPTFTFITDATAEITISAADVTFYNCRFLSNYEGGLTAGIQITADGDGTRFISCEFRETSATKEMLTMITAAAAADELVFAGNRFIGIATGTATGTIVFTGASDYTQILDNYFYVDVSDYVIDASAAASIAMDVGGNTIHNLDTGAGKIMTFNATTTGSVYANTGYGNGASFVIVGTAMFVAPDNIAVNTETPARNYESMTGPFTGSTGGAAGTNIYSDMVLAQTDLDAIIVDLTAAVTQPPVATSLHDILHKDGSYTYDNITDSLEMNSDIVGAYTGDGGTDNNDSVKSDVDLLQTDVTSLIALIAAINDTGYVGTCTNNATTTVAIVPLLAGFGDDYFNTEWSIICILDFSAAGSAPEGEIIDIIDYESATGTFTTNVAFTAALTTGDGVMIRRTEELELDVPTILESANTIRYVDSGTSGDGSGLTWENAYATIALAEAACDAGDAVYVADNHNEAIGSLVIDVAGVKVIGMGEGDGRPILDFDAAGDEITINAGGIVFRNFRLMPSASDVVAAIVVGNSGDGVLIENVAFITGEGADEEFRDCVSVGTTAVGVTVKSCTYYNTNATAADQDTFVNLDAATIDSASVVGCTIFGTFAEAPIWAFTAIPTNINIADNVISNTTSGQLCIEFQGAATGVIKNNLMYSDTFGANGITILDPGSASCIGNFAVDAINERAIEIPISAETSDVTEVADGSDLERLEYLQNLGSDALGMLSSGGSVFYCDSGEGTGTEDGLTWATATDTIKEAIDLCTDNNGDVILVAPGHAETIGASVAVNSDGVMIIGLGVQDERPTLTFNATASSLAHTVPGVKWKDIIFVCSTQDTTVAISLDASSDGAVLEDCEFRNTTTSEFIDTVTLQAATDNVRFTSVKFLNNTAAGGNISCINSTVGVTVSLVIEDCYFYGAFTTAAIESDQIEVDLRIANNRIYNTSTGDAAILLTGAALGVMSDNYCYGDTLTNIIDPGSMQCFNNFISHEIDATGYLYPPAPQKIPSTEGTARIIFVDSGATAGGGGTWETAFNTIDAAMDDTVADRGDIIYVAQGHVEVEAGAAAIFTCDVEGVSIIGISNGSASGAIAAGAVTGTDSQMPVFILDNAGATISVTAANVTLSGLWIESDVIDAAIGITVAATGDGSVIKNCVFRDGAAAEELVIGISIAADADNCQILDNSFSTVPAGGCTNAILLAGGMDDGVIRGNIAYGTWSTGTLLASGAASVNLTIMDNIFVTTSANVCVSLNAGTTGILASNRMGSADTILNTLQGETAMYTFDNYATGAPAASGVLTPAADSD